METVAVDESKLMAKSRYNHESTFICEVTLGLTNLLSMVFPHQLLFAVNIRPHE